jgi:hypothetical protein
MRRQFLFEDGKSGVPSRELRQRAVWQIKQKCVASAFIEADACLNPNTRLHGVITNKTRTSISTSVKTQNLYGCVTWSLALREDTQTENEEDIWAAEGKVGGA